MTVFLPLLATAKSPQNQLTPQPGEIALFGSVVSIDAANKRLVLKATAFTLPNGKNANLAASKEKPLLINDATSIHAAGKIDKMALGDLKAGDVVTVIGPDAGSGKELVAREVVVGEK